MKKCKSCQSEIDPKASKCPHCGADQRNWFARHKIISGILGLVVLLMVIGVANGGKTGSKGSSTSSSPTAQTTTAPSTTPKEPLKIADSMAWVKEYDKNKLTANDKYKGQYVQFSGIIKNITESMGTPYLSLEPTGANEFYLGTTINCDFASAELLKALENGKSVILRGTVDEQSFGVIGVKDCSIVQQ